ncbi:MAG: four helix bundle protein [Caldilineaceae bacterium]|nr:four helix bundle protein [Caldilineaceae bacterium]
MPKGDDIEERLIGFAVRMIALCSHLPNSTAGRHIGRQIMRSGTSPAPNYAEARSAESVNDFIHKLRICLKELNETRIWLRIITDSRLIKPERLADLQTECDELCRILAASIKTATRRKNH